MGFPIDLPLGKGVTINYLLCIIALSCFFSGTSVARWWWLECKRLFCNPLPPWKGGTAKSVTEKKQQQGGLCGSRQKDRASPEVRGTGIFGGWGFCPGGAARNKLSGET